MGNLIRAMCSKVRQNFVGSIERFDGLGCSNISVFDDDEILGKWSCTLLPII